MFILRFKTPFFFPLILAVSSVHGLTGFLPTQLSAATSSPNENTELHVIDVYEGIPHESGVIDVYVTTKNKPLVLYLGAYQPVKWNLITEPGVQMSESS